MLPIVPELNPTQPRKHEFDYDLIIAGAGLAGMTLAWNLIQQNYQGKMLILDNRSDFSREQRWCTWGPVSEQLLPLVTHRWSSWQAISPETCTYRFQTVQTPYMEFHAQTYYKHINDQIKERDNFTLNLSTEVKSVTTYKNRGIVETNDSIYNAQLVIDARNESVLKNITKQSDEPWLYQSFVGGAIVTQRPFCDPETATLMQFLPDIPSENPEIGAFVYLLPYSATEVFVEYTIVAKEIYPRQFYLDQIDAFLTSQNIEKIAWKNEEIGAIPMTAHRFEPWVKRSPIIRIGTAAGGIKPSSGYGFARIQAQCTQLADLIISGQIDKATGKERMPRRDFIDSIFLDIIAAEPNRLSQLMLRMFQNIPPATIVRFLSERSDLLDDLLVMAAVGDLSFVSPAMKRAIKLLNHHN